MDKKRTGESLKDLFKGDKEGNSKQPKSQSAKTRKRQRFKELKRQSTKESNKRKHTIYLSPEQSKKLRVYAAEHDLQLSDVIQKLIEKNL